MGRRLVGQELHVVTVRLSCDLTTMPLLPSLRPVHDAAHLKPCSTIARHPSVKRHCDLTEDPYDGAFW